MARPDFPNGKITMVTLVWRWVGVAGGGGVTPPPPEVYGQSNTSLGLGPTDSDTGRSCFLLTSGCTDKGCGR